MLFKCGLNNCLEFQNYDIGEFRFFNYVFNIFAGTIRSATKDLIDSVKSLSDSAKVLTESVNTKQSRLLQVR